MKCPLRAGDSFPLARVAAATGRYSVEYEVAIFADSGDGGFWWGLVFGRGWGVFGRGWQCAFGVRYVSFGAGARPSGGGREGLYVLTGAISGADPRRPSAALPTAMAGSPARVAHRGRRTKDERLQTAGSLAEAAVATDKPESPRRAYHWHGRRPATARARLSVKLLVRRSRPRAWPTAWSRATRYTRQRGRCRA